MSDYISNINNYVTFCKRIHEQQNSAPNDNFSNPSDANQLKTDIGFERDVNSQQLSQGRCNQIRGSFEEDCFQNNNKSLIESMDVSDFRKLERLSANLTQLLNDARQNKFSKVICESYNY
jgi:hypothetical protein